MKLDTGMSRLGFQTGEESIDEIERIFYLPGIRMEGLFTHFAKADEMDKTFTNRQMEEVSFMTRKLKERGLSHSTGIALTARLSSTTLRPIWISCVRASHSTGFILPMR